jgi:hypothetical protein
MGFTVPLGLVRVAHNLAQKNHKPTQKIESKKTATQIAQPTLTCKFACKKCRLGCKKYCASHVDDAG